MKEYNLKNPATLLQPDIIRSWGYPAEEYHVTTPDGYILALHRIPHSVNGRAGGIPVILGHCLVGSSAIWAFGPPDHSLAYQLADKGKGLQLKWK